MTSSGKQPQEPERENSNTKKESLPSVVSGSDTAKAAPRHNNSHTPKNWYQSLQQKAKQNGITGWKIFEGAGILAGIAYALITYCQWQDLRHNFEVDQRAWLRAKVNWLPQISESEVQMTIMNMGKSPALVAKMDAVFEVVDHDKGPTWKWFDDKHFHTKSSANVIFPGDDFKPHVVRYYENGGVWQLSREELQRLRDGDAYIAVWGQVLYRDQFGVHWTRFCDWKPYDVVVTPAIYREFEAGSCTSFNSVGENEPPR